MIGSISPLPLREGGAAKLRRVRSACLHEGWSSFIIPRA
jgi:hypothetical protein